jgi:ferredoxin
MSMSEIPVRRPAGQLRINPIACSGHGVCAELLPELITLDDWGYPLLGADGAVPVRLARMARRAVTDCPALALSLTALQADRSGSSEEAQRPARRRAARLRT